ncbi:M48 family metallopeptidase [Hydromonas duriensis]|uniref:Peptidase M48-like protein n=1 Tax=Hydromonas duriensis TaxID=1527608 RepID=A0A4V3DJX6_9BURK|nr:M48 family metallopeptidase [Hydromonas duriensis]TDR31840.1 peptidase M48-like protein [Hydromonas duriensis]
MARIEFYDGTSALAHQAQLSVINGQLIIHANEQMFTIHSTDINPTLSTPNGRRFIHLPNNMALEFHDNADAERILDALNTPHLKNMRWFDRHYRSWGFLLGSFLVFIGLIASLYVFALPAAANYISTRLPSHILDDISKEALAQMESDGDLLPSKLSKARQAELLNKFNALKKPDTDIPFTLHFFSSPDTGPNAFALPSGDVVLLDELVNITTNDDQTMGVLAHELGHVAHRHSMRNIIQSSIVSFAIANWLGDYGNTIANFGAATLLSGKYSRDFERDADNYAIYMMKINQMSPAELADFFVILDSELSKKANPNESADTNTQPTAAAKPNKSLNIGNLFDDHPPTQERIANFRQAANTN